MVGLEIERGFDWEERVILCCHVRRLLRHMLDSSIMHGLLL